MADTTLNPMLPCSVRHGTIPLTFRERQMKLVWGVSKSVAFIRADD